MKSQADKIYELLKDGLAHSTPEILSVVYGNEHAGLARIGARIWDLKKRGAEIQGWKDEKNPSIYWYRMKVPKPVGFRELAYIDNKGQRIVITKQPIYNLKIYV